MNLEVRDRVNKTWKQKLWSWWEMEVVATVPRAAVEVAMVPAAGSVGKYAWCSVGGDNDWLLWQLCSSSCAAAAVTTAWHCCSGGVMLWLLFRVAAAVVTIARSCTGWLIIGCNQQCWAMTKIFENGIFLRRNPACLSCPFTPEVIYWILI